MVAQAPPRQAPLLFSAPEGTLFLWVQYCEYGWDAKLDGILLYCVGHNEWFSTDQSHHSMGVHMAKVVLLGRGKGFRAFSENSSTDCVCPQSTGWDTGTLPLLAKAPNIKGICVLGGLSYG